MRYLIVKYWEGQKGYTYETENDSIKIEDFVIVPMGKYNEHVVAKVIGETTSKPNFECKKIIKKIDLYEEASLFKVGDIFMDLESEAIIEILNDDNVKEFNEIYKDGKRVFIRMHRNEDGTPEFNTDEMYKLGGSDQ